MPINQARQARVKPALPKGPFHIQVGAYATKREAEMKIMEVRKRMGAKLGAHHALTVPFNLRNKKLFYRARFAGFDHDRASALCGMVKAAHFDCIVMRAE